MRWIGLSTLGLSLIGGDLLRWLKHRSILGKIFFLFGVLLLLNALMGVISWRKLTAVVDAERSTEHSVAARQIASLTAIDHLREILEAHDRAQQQFSVARGRAPRGEFDRKRREALDEIQPAAEKCESLLSEGEPQRIYIVLKQDLAEYVAVSRRMTALPNDSGQRGLRKRRKSRDGEARRLPWEEASETLKKSLSDLNVLAQAVANPIPPKESAGSWLQLGDTRKQIEVLTILGGALGLILVYATASNIASTLGGLADAAGRIAAGDLSGEALEAGGLKGAGELAWQIDAIRISLRKQSQILGGSVQRMGSISGPIATACRQQMEAAGLQHEVLQQVSGTLLGTAAGIKEVTSQSLRAARAARQAAANAMQGRSAADATLTHLGEISKALGDASIRLAELGKCCEQIGKGIVVLDESVSHIKLLARNASSEAARAGHDSGETGIIAWEVGQLSERALSASQTIRLSVDRLQFETAQAEGAADVATTEARAGMENGRRARDLLQNSLAASQELGRIVAQVATAAAEVVGDDETAARLNLISEVGRESAEAAQRTAAAVAELSELAAALENSAGSWEGSPVLIPFVCAIGREEAPFDGTGEEWVASVPGTAD
jgi:methyl-accepting chemotaxis protein